LSQLSSSPAQHVQVDQTAVDRRQGQRLECIQRPLGAGDVGGDHQFQILDPIPKPSVL